MGDPVLTISAEAGVKVELTPNEYFTLDGNVVEAAVEFDFEVPQITRVTTDGVFAHVW